MAETSFPTILILDTTSASLRSERILYFTPPSQVPSRLKDSLIISTRLAPAARLSTVGAVNRKTISQYGSRGFRGLADHLVRGTGQ
jgi:hypothetical protein